MSAVSIMDIRPCRGVCSCGYCLRTRNCHFDDWEATFQAGLGCEKSTADRTWSLSKHYTYLLREVVENLSGRFGPGILQEGQSEASLWRRQPSVSTTGYRLGSPRSADLMHISSMILMVIWASALQNNVVQSIMAVSMLVSSTTLEVWYVIHIFIY